MGKQNIEEKGNGMDIQIRAMEIKDYDQLYQLWLGIQGFGIRTLDDSREGIDKFLKRNPATSAVAEEDGRIVGGILCGHDGRRGCFYHVCVAKDYRKHGIGTKMAHFCMRALQKEGINKVTLIAFKRNGGGNEFWKKVNWTYRDDINYYDFSLNDENITEFIK